MPRPIWKGAISFGVVSIPVRLYAATSDKEISFHLLHKDDNSRIKYLRWCPIDERVVENEEIVKGYEYAKGQYVVLTDEDFDRLPLPTRHTIELLSFVKAEEIDPVYYDKSYFLEPDQLGAKPYALMFRALTERGLAALAKVALRTKERLCAVSPRKDVLMMETLYYPNEIQVEKAPAPDILVSKQELSMAFTFIDLLTGPFEPEKFHDRYQDALQETIEAKLQGREVVAAPPAPAVAPVDLMSALRASVEAAKKEKEAEAVEATGTEAPRKSA